MSSPSTSRNMNEEFTDDGYFLSKYLSESKCNLSSCCPEMGASIQT